MTHAYFKLFFAPALGLILKTQSQSHPNPTFHPSDLEGGEKRYRIKLLHKPSYTYLLHSRLDVMVQRLRTKNLSPKFFPSYICPYATATHVFVSGHFLSPATFYRKSVISDVQKDGVSKKRSTGMPQFLKFFGHPHRATTSAISRQITLRLLSICLLLVWLVSSSSSSCSSAILLISLVSLLFAVLAA